MRNVIVTGGAGYIGSHTCKALAQAGYRPVTYDNLSQGHEGAVQWGPLERGDINDRDRLDRLFDEYAPEAVLHFAGLTAVGESVENPAIYYANNVRGSLTLLEAMRDHGIDRFVFSSTCATYGEPENIPMGEDHPQIPLSPYGWTKLTIEKAATDYFHAYGLRGAFLRYFNAAGADPEGEIGEAHDPETHLIPLVVDTALGKRPFITIFGDDYPTPDGTCIRDYIHVTDLANAHVSALRYLEANPVCRAFNLGNGRGYSVREIVQSVERVTGEKVNTQMGKRRAGDAPRLVGDAQRARAELGWTPAFAELDVIVDTAWRWAKGRK